MHGHDYGPEHAVDDHTGPVECCCLYDDVVDHVNAGVDDVKVGMQERGRVESAELERGNPGTSGLHPIHTRTTSLCRICHKYIHGHSFQLFVWSDDRKHNGGSIS